MRKEEKKFKEYLEHNLPVRDTYREIASRIDFREEKRMKKKSLWYIFGGTVATAAIVTAVVLMTAGGIGGSSGAGIKGPYAMVNVDVNPSISLVIDTDEKVLSVTGNNDDGKLVVSGEAIVGKSLNEALNMIVEIETETGYLVSGNVSAGENKISVSVSAETTADVNELQDRVTSSLETICDTYNVQETVEIAERYTREQLESLALLCDPSLDAETVSSMTYRQLLTVVSLYQLETVELYSEKLEELYQYSKENEIRFVEKEAVQTAIGDVNALYQILVQSYSSFCSQLKELSDSIEDLRYSLLVQPDSAYQVALKSVKDAKKEVLKLKNEIAKLETSDEVIDSLTAQLEIKEQLLTSVMESLTDIESSVNATISKTQESLQALITQLEELEASFPDEITDKIEAALQDTEKKVNDAKDGFFTSFEAKYADEIAHFKEEVQKRKQEMIDSLKSA